MLKDEFQYYLNHQSELVSQYEGKFIVLKDEKIIGVYDSNAIAYSETLKNHELGTFLIQFCQEGSDSYSQTFHSRVIINATA